MMWSRQERMLGRFESLVPNGDPDALDSPEQSRRWTGLGVGTRTVRGRVVHVHADDASQMATGADDQREAEGRRTSEHPSSGTGVIRLFDPGALRRQLADALATVASDLSRLSALGSPEVADILDAQAMMAEDPTLVERLVARLAPDARDQEVELDRSNLTTAFLSVANELRAVGGYIGERADDVCDIGTRAVDLIFGSGEVRPQYEANPESILVFDQLSAADAARLGAAPPRGVIVTTGGPTGHAALVLRSLDISAIVGCSNALEIPDGLVVELDPIQAIVMPSSPLASDRSPEPRVRRAIARSVLASGAVRLLANVGSVADALEARSQGADGIGLVRTEFLFVSQEREPDQGEQVSAYRAIMAPFEGSGLPVVVRTLDAGSDKPLGFVDLPREENPALGVRGFRLARQLSGLLERQLSALAAAKEEVDAVDLWVMAPMITTIAEVEAFTTMARSAGVKSVGVMIEVPALALDFGSAAKLVDFASVGTNDLVQYLMGADRNASRLGDLLDPWSPVVLRLLQSVARWGRQRAVPISVCGEAASDPLLGVVLTGLGVTSLSMVPVALGPVRTLLGSVSRTEARRLAHRATGVASAHEARRFVATALGLG